MAATLLLEISNEATTICRPKANGRPEIWLAPYASIDQLRNDRSAASDYFDLFRDDAPWSAVAARIRVFKIYRDQILLMSDDQLIAIIEGLARRDIALAIETNVLVQTSTCAPNVNKAKPITPVIERLKRLGADLRYLAMNEPLVGGHILHGAQDCSASVDAVAADVAASVRPLFAIYPDMEVGDIEPVGRLPDVPGWPDEIAVWIKAYREAVGRPLAFMHADTVWGRPWREDLRELARVTHAAGLPFGVIYNGDFSELSDAGWAEDTAYYASQVEDEVGLHPDQVIFQSWVKWPSHSLPESGPTTMTGMVRDYLRVRSSVIVGRNGRIRLIDENGAPVPNAKLSVLSHDRRLGATVVRQRMEGEVPPGAKTALFGLRVNAECQCPHALVDLSIGDFTYAEQGNSPAFVWNLREWAAMKPSVAQETAVGTKSLLHVSVKPDQDLVLNGPRFSVLAGAHFRAEFEWQVSPPSAGAGYATLVFLGNEGLEVRRTLHRLAPTWRNVDTIATDAEGLAVLRPCSACDATDDAVSLSYPGDADHRPARLDLR